MRNGVLLGALVAIVAVLGASLMLRPKETVAPVVPFTPTEAALVGPRRLAVLPDIGEVAIADPGAHRVFRLRGRELGVLAGTGRACEASCCEGAADATAIDLAAPADVAVFGDGLLIANSDAGCVLNRDPEGRVVRFAGRGPEGPLGDRRFARDARLDRPRGIAVWPGRGVLIAEAGGCRVRLVAEDSRIITVAGTGECGFGGDGGPALSAQLGAPSGVAVWPDGTGFVIADTANGRVRSVGTAGTIVTIAGNGGRGLSGDGGVGTDGTLSDPEGLGFIRGALWIADTGNDRLRILRAGTLSSYAPQTRVGPLRLKLPAGLTISAGGVAIADTGSKRIVWATEDGRQGRVLAGEANAPAATADVAPK